MQTDHILSHIDKAPTEGHDHGDENSVSTEAVPSAAELTIDVPVDGHAIPLSETTERHLGHGSLQGLAELAEDGASVGEGGASSPANDETSKLWNNSEPEESWDLGRLAKFIRGRLSPHRRGHLVDRASPHTCPQATHRRSQMVALVGKNRDRQVVRLQLLRALQSLFA